MNRTHRARFEARMGTLHRGRTKALTLIALLFCTQFGQGCIEWVMAGVHFKWPAMDFTKTPRQFAHHYESSDGWRPGTAYLAEGDITPEPIHDSEYVVAKTGNQFRAAYVANTLKLEREHQFGKALKAWERAWHQGYVGHGDLRERLAVLHLLAVDPKLAGGAALLASIPLDGSARPIPASSSVAPSLKPLAEYLIAAASKGSPLEVADRLAFVAGNYPQTSVAEAALISIPRKLLGKAAGKPNPESIALAQRAMNRLFTRYPKTRFKQDIFGWQGRIAYLAGDYVRALGLYRRQLGLIKEGESVWRATDSIELCEQRLGRPANVAIAFLIRYARSPEALEKDSSTVLLEGSISALKGEAAISFGHQVRANPQLLAYYLDYRLDFTDATPELLDFEHAQCLSKSNSQERGHVAARLAEAALRLRQPGEALRLAEKIDHSSASDDDMAIADYIRGTMARKSGRTTVAVRYLEHLKDSYPKSYLLGAAMENLALLYESRGSLNKALDLYRKLGYDLDVTYMVDIRMTPSQLREYTEDHPDDPKRNLFEFSLGYRYMRIHDWNSAEREFQSIPKRTRLKMLNRSEITDYYDRKDPIQDPLDTTRDLRKLSRTVDQAEGATSRAKAIFAEANYYYSRRNLLLYNASLWRSSRTYSFAYSWNDKAANKADNEAIGRHHWEHECLAQAYLLCRKVVESRAGLAARTRAAYLGACAGARLSKMNEYWRWKNTQINVLGSSIQLMKFASTSPNKWLAARAAKYAGVFQAEQEESHRGEFARKLGASVYRVGWGYH